MFELKICILPSSLYCTDRGGSITRPPLTTPPPLRCRLYCVKRKFTELETDRVQYCCDQLLNTTVIHVVQTAANARNVQLTSVYRDKTDIFCFWLHTCALRHSS